MSQYLSITLAIYMASCTLYTSGLIARCTGRGLARAGRALAARWLDGWRSLAAWVRGVVAARERRLARKEQRVAHLQAESVNALATTLQAQALEIAALRVGVKGELAAECRLID